ncbi:4'-phosphopantetheinyl transferase [Psychromonas marina]|uniref:4'-phosphopantetheinyl transferase n=1 Tax=Psychromonas marina TaxID=88364 RepID=A0ABQ6DYC2_9GAMM|nr:4'-phosphopantetheinyl transferase superfamily protein [Psychromonas marina]GLS90156.1 4'-phosphopantetheinyl transferase [Psychromonas marina]
MLSNISSVALADNEIHIWAVNPKQISEHPSLRALLSDSECQKIDRYRLSSAKHTALITRSFIRLLLSQYAPVAPKSWQFSVGELGKPEITNAPLPLRFNLSHNDELIICAVCLNKDIGCDIENLSRKISVNAIADRFFSSDEAQRVKASPKQFFEYWTLKESFVKATGLGISQGLETFSFAVNASTTANFNDNIVLTFNEKCKQQSPQHWYQALLFPDNKHCIAVSINNNKTLENKPAIQLFSMEQGASLFNR